MKNPGVFLPDAFKAIVALNAAVHAGGVDPKTLHLVHLRASQLNGCSACVEGGSREAKKVGETDDRLYSVAAWRESPHFTDAERAALALAESMTRLSDRPDPVPDAVWDDAKRYFDDKALATIVLETALTNLFNRVNVAIRQPGGKQAWER